MSKKLSALICIAHPDDEAIFFGGLITSQKYNWTVVCVTDGNADRQGKMRADQLRQSCLSLGVKNLIQWNFPDQFEKRLDTTTLIERFKTLGHFERVFTHGVLGEYGHPHHQDVSFAAHAAFSKKSKVYSVAHNIFPDLSIKLSASAYKLKSQILLTTYASETKRFLGFLPITSQEGFIEVQLNEVQEIYRFITDAKSLNKRKIRKYRELFDYIKSRDFDLKIRPF